LADLAESYGAPVGEGVEIFAASDIDFADLADVTETEARQTLQKWQDKGWLDCAATENKVFCVTNPKQLGHLTANFI
ncbi:MAG: Crp/Fnr family transcriptional regulator, partial [Cyanobacteria bacterium J06641_5]